MRILVHEFASGGGFSGRPVPASLAREGGAMLAALVADIAAIGEHRVVTTADPRYPLKAPRGVEVVTLPPGAAGRLDELIAAADAVWLVAPETSGCLERLAAKAERKGKVLLGTGAAAIRLASDKAGLPRRLARQGVAHPETCVVRRRASGRAAARRLGYPLVVKPARGAGCGGVGLVRDARGLRGALELARRTDPRGPLVIQRYVRGAPASVSLLADGVRAVALAANAQSVRAAKPFAYRGGATPLEHPLAGRALEAALAACRALPGLRGYVGVDLVLTDSDAVVIEVNPRLTTSYLGLRAALEGNLAALSLAACAGKLPPPPPLRRRVRFSAAGRVVPARPLALPRVG
jgi:predicted ATP-grasp superfamily ATP-dependent carboligase